MAKQNTPIKGTASKHRLWWLIGGRLTAGALVLVARAISDGSLFGNDNSRSLFANPLLIAAAATLLFSIIYVAALLFSKIEPKRQAGVQIFFDVPLITWLVWATGDISSPYTGLMIAVVAVAGIFLGKRGSLVTSVGCAACYTAVMLATAFGWLPHVGARAISDTSRLEAIYMIAFNDIAFFVVGLLAARLAERNQRSDVELIEATHALTNLRALYERIVESIRSGVVTIDLDGRIYTLNRAAEEITGYKAADLRNQPASVLFGDLTEHIKESTAAILINDPSPRFECETVTPDDLRVRLGFSIVPLSAEEGETTGFVVTFQDLTEVRALEEAKRRQDRLAAVGRIAAGIAHEVRNPLASIRGSIQVLGSEMPANSAEAELMEIVLRESDRLNRIITDFLTYARPRPVSLEAVDVRESLHETLTLLRHSPELHGHHILEEDSFPEPVNAMADAAALRQIFWNLARNALQAMPDGGTLRAAVERLESTGRISITFTDTGRGMSPDQVERLFEPFSPTRTGSGTGLGLSIVYQIVRDHNGTINVRSRVGHGTAIKIELPSANLDVRDQMSEVNQQTEVPSLSSAN